MSPNKTVPQQRFFPDDLVHLFYTTSCICLMCSCNECRRGLCRASHLLHGSEECRSSPRVFLLCPSYVLRLSTKRRKVVFLQSVLFLRFLPPLRISVCSRRSSLFSFI